MQVITTQVEELKKQVQMQIKDFSNVLLLEKSIIGLKKKEIAESSQLNQLCQIASGILDVYFMLEEEYELDIYRITDNELQMKNEADEISLDFALKVGNIAIGLVNFCYKQSLKCNEQTKRFTNSQLEDLITINVNYCRKILDLSRTQSNEEFITYICETNSLIFDLLSDHLEKNNNLQSMKFCNEFNLLEIKSINPKTNFTDLLKHSSDILGMFDKYRQLESSKKYFIENMLIILFRCVEDCQAKKIEQLLQMTEGHPILLQNADVGYQIHVLKLNLLHAINIKDAALISKLEIEYNDLNASDTTTDAFQFILKIRKLKINSEQKCVQQLLQQIEEFQIKYRPFTINELSQLLSEIVSLGANFYYIIFMIYRQYIMSVKQTLIKDNKLQDSFYQSLILFCTIIDEFFLLKDFKKHFESVLDECRECLKQIIGIMLQVKKFTAADINNQQVFYQRVCKLILEVSVNLKDLKEKSILNTLEIIEIFLLLLKKQQTENSQHQLFIDEVSCVGLICAIKGNQEKYIKDFSHNIQGSFSILPQILLAHTKKEEISVPEFQKFINGVLRQNDQKSKGQNKNLINLFALKNLIQIMDNYPALLEFYTTFIDQNFLDYFQFFKQNFVEHYLERAPDVSLCTPFVKKIISLKQNVTKNLLEIQSTTKTVFLIIDRFYEIYSKNDQTLPLSILITDKERKDLIQIMHSYFGDANVSSDPRVSCKFLNYIVLISCLDIVFTSIYSYPAFESSYVNQSISKLNYILTNTIDSTYTQKQNQANPSEQQCADFKNPYFLKSLVLLFSYQVCYYELQLQSDSYQSQTLATLENLIESYELTSSNLIEYLSLTNKSIDLRVIKNQFYTFQFVMAILKQNMAKCISVTEIFLREYPNQLALLSQISKTKQKVDLSQIINKKYIYFLSYNNVGEECNISNFIITLFIQIINQQIILKPLTIKLCLIKVDIIFDLAEHLENNGQQIDQAYYQIKTILKRIIHQSQLTPQQKETIEFVIKELISKFRQISQNHTEIQQLQGMQTHLQQNIPSNYQQYLY